jgi:hypothetical protein
MLCFTQFQSQAAQGPLLLDPSMIESYVNEFNAEDRWFFQVSTDEEVSQVNNGVYGGQYVKNADLDQNGHSDAFDYLKDNIPLFDAPDADLVKTYYFRWWTYRKHIKNIGTEQNPSFVLTEFIDPVDWADPVTNTISCPSSHHIYEGRWIHQSKLMDDYERYWMTNSNATPRRYSCWLADAIYARYKVNPDDGLVTELVADQTNLLNLETNYNGWVSGATQSAYRDTDDGLFWQIDDRDGMEVSYGGSGKRATLNSYMFGDTRAIAQMFRIAAEYDTENAATYLQKADLFDNTAESIKQAMLGYLWDPADEFFKVGYNDFPGGSLQGRRELHGFTPWYFNMPDDGGAVNYDLAWSHLGSFTTAYGFTSGAHDETGYNTGSVGSCCRWDGPIWPYATAITLKAMANLLRNYDQSYVDTDDYFNQLMIYSDSHEETYTIGGGPDTISCIDESMVSGGVDGGHWTQIGVPNTPRGFAYNHSTFCDLIISDLIGLQPRADGVVEVDPLVPQGQWAWFCLDNILYHGRTLTIVWDQNGTKYGQGSGLRVYADGTLIASSSTLQKVQGYPSGGTVTVPNGDFETIYKPGQTMITATFSSGGWSQGVGPDCPIEYGQYNFSDQTSGTIADITGWLGYDRDGWIAWGGSYGRDQTTGNLQGNISSGTNNTSGGSHSFGCNGAGWGNPAGGLITSAASLGNVLSGTTYTLSMYANGDATPVVLNLLAGGVVVTPSSSVSPTLSSNWQEFSRTYDDEDLTSYIGQAITIVCGLGRDAAGNQFHMDDILLTYVGGGGDTDPPTPNPATFASAPAAVSSSQITMTATTGTDATGPVEYYFEETTGHSGGSDSGWTTNPVYNDTGLSASTQYTYTVQIRDALLNTGTASSPASETTYPTGGTITLPNSGFETIYKPDSTVITGVLSPSGSSWTQGVGPDCPIDSGQYNFSDQTTGTLADIPGWLGYDKAGWIAWGGTYGRDQATGNLQGSVSTTGGNHTPGGLNCYLANGGGWGNAAGGLIVSNASLGNIASVATYTLSMYAKGDATPVVLKLLANGTELTPTSSVSPTLSGDWQEFSRTYDAGDITSYVGQAMTIVCGIGRNASGNQTQMDDVSLSYFGGGGSGTGLKGDYYDNMDFTAFTLIRTDATVNFDWGTGSPDPSIGADSFSARWTGEVKPLYSETYTFKTNSDDGVRLWVNSQQIINNWTDHGPTIDSGNIALSAGVKYDIRLEFYESGGGAVIQLSWLSASQTEEIIPQTQLYPNTGDTYSPTPNPATFSSAPAAVSSSQITMTATTGSDATGPVEYYFDETTGNPGATDSGWVTNPVYNDTGLSPSTQYTYTVKMRDSAPTPNVGTASSPASATTQAAPAPTFVAAGAVSSGTGTISPALPAGIAANDILLLFIETANQAVSITNQNGGTWAEVTGSPQGTGTAGGTSATRLTVFWSRYNGTQGAPTVSDSGNHQAARMIAIRGAVSSGDPWNVTAGGVDATSDTSASIPGSTTTVINTLVVVATAGSLPDANGTAQFSAWTNANLTSLTERTDDSRSSGNGGSLGIATGVKATAGAYGNTAATHATSAVKGMISIAIKP